MYYTPPSSPGFGAASTLHPGMLLRLQSYNYRDRSLTHSGSSGHLRIEGGGDQVFGIGPGAAPGYLTLGPASNPSILARHRNFELHGDAFDGSELNRLDASFRAVPSLVGDPSAVSFESLNYPQHYLRHSGFALFCNKSDGSSLFAGDASFIPQPDYSSVGSSPLSVVHPGAVVRLQSQNYPDRFLTNTGHSAQLRIEGGGDQVFGIGPGATPGFVTLGPASNPSILARHRNFELHADAFDGSELNRLDASFRPVRGLTGDPRAVSFESLNYPQHFLRHSGFALFCNKNDGSSLFAGDASFIPSVSIPPTSVFRPGARVRLQSQNFPDRFLTNTGQSAHVRIEGGGDHVFGVGPGAAPGYVTLGPASNPAILVRHRNFELHGDAFDGSELNRLDASFRAVPGLSGDPRSVSFESLNYPQHFLRHSGFALFCSKSDGSSLFGGDASFIPFPL